jgi:nucleotide-binding universal stress UspA family protein
MPSLAKLLLPVDFSERSIGAARYAIQLAGRFQSGITLLHVLPPISVPAYEYPELSVATLPGDLLIERQSQAEKRLEGFLEGTLNGPRVTRVVIEGDPATSIVDYAAGENSDLILMPTHGYGPFRRLLLGSVTAKVLHGADCPVWTSAHVEAPAPPPAGLKHIVCAVDLGAHSATVLGWAAWLASEYRARLTLVHVVALDPRTEAYYFSPEWRGHLIHAAKQDLEKLQAGAGTDAPVHLELGDVHRAIRTAAESLEADLLVIGRSPASGVAGRLASHAYAIIRDSPCPVISV